MITQNGTLYIYEPKPDGGTYAIPVEETPDDLSFLQSQTTHVTTVPQTLQPIHDNSTQVATSAHVQTPPNTIQPHVQSVLQTNQSELSVSQSQAREPAVQPQTEAENTRKVLMEIAAMTIEPHDPFRSRFIQPNGSSGLSRPNNPPRFPTQKTPAPRTVSSGVQKTSTPIAELPNIPAQPVVTAHTVSSDAKQAPVKTVLETVKTSEAIPQKITDIPLSTRIQMPKPASKPSVPWPKIAGATLLLISAVGLYGVFGPKATMDVAYKTSRTRQAIVDKINPAKPLPPAVPVVFNPLIDASGNAITPVNTDFGIIIPKIGVNAPVVPFVDPSKQDSYNAALKNGVAHASTSFTPDQNGTTYLFSHSTSYEWFVKDLNAVFYLVKNMQPGDLIVLYYHGVQYTYEMKEARIVKPSQVSYLIPEEGRKSLILQTCWPPGETTERMLIFADLISEDGKQI